MQRVIKMDDRTMEIWKDVKGYEGLYQVSNLGRVKSFRKSTKYGMPEEIILKPSMINSGYHVVSLYSPNKKKKKFQVHRLVAESFLSNKDNLPCVNHKDENKTNNCSSNLEWCTYQYNNNYGTARLRSSDTVSKAVSQFTLEGELIAKYRSVAVASELLNHPKYLLSLWCRKGMGGGYKWRYENESI